MGKVTTYMNVYQNFEILGNKDGFDVTNYLKKNGYSFGSGEINTGGKHGDRAYVTFEGTLKKTNGGYARFDFSYYIKTGDLNISKKKGEYIGICNKVIYIKSLQPYNTERTWNEGDYECKEKFTWSFVSTPQKFSCKDYIKTGSSRHGWVDFDESSYSESNKLQSWVSADKLQFKIDDSGNEVSKVGNIGVKGQLCIRIAVTKETTRKRIINSEELEVSKKRDILNKDKKATNINQMMAYREMPELEDGFASLDNVCIPETNSSGALLKGQREEALGVTEYLFPRSNSNMPSTDYYPGTILIVDENFRNRLPNKLTFEEQERKPLNFICSLPSTGLTLNFDNVLPTERNLTKRRLEFITKYSQVMKEAALPSISQIKTYSYENANGISIGGSIKGIDFNLAGLSRKKTVKIFEFKQILYSISLDDTYKKASDFFTSKLDLSAFKKSLGAYSPAIIDTVHYGKIAYIAVSSEDKSALNVTVNSVTGAIGGETKNCKFTAISIGGVAGSANGVYDFTNADDLNDFMSKFRAEMTAGVATAAVPIEFEASYLADPSKKVKTNIRKYFHKFVDKVKVKVTENNKGASMSGLLMYLDRYYNKYGKLDYTFEEVKKNLDFTVEVSPWAVCFVLKIDVKGARDKYDYNLFIPYIPLEKLEQDNDGDWMFTIKLGGSTYANAKDAEAQINPTVPGCYFSKNNGVYRGTLNESEYLDKTEEEVLTSFFEWCEREDADRDCVSKLSGEKDIKTSRT